MQLLTMMIRMVKSSMVDVLRVAKESMARGGHRWSSDGAQMGLRTRRKAKKPIEVGIVVVEETNKRYFSNISKFMPSLVLTVDTFADVI
eukprot:scaffold4389_cov44-Cyclotella_meneghiniana.AAC.3